MWLQYIIQMLFVNLFLVSFFVGVMYTCFESFKEETAQFKIKTKLALILEFLHFCDLLGIHQVGFDLSVLFVNELDRSNHTDDTEADKITQLLKSTGKDHKTLISEIDEIKGKMNVNYTMMFQKMKVSHEKQMMVAKE